VLHQVLLTSASPSRATSASQVTARLADAFGNLNDDFAGVLSLTASHADRTITVSANLTPADAATHVFRIVPSACGRWHLAANFAVGSYVVSGTGELDAQCSTRAITNGCAVAAETGELKCWGTNASGELGIGNHTNHGYAPNTMGDTLAAINLGTGRQLLAMDDCGAGFRCALLDNHDLKCWGSNGDGNLGLGDYDDRGDTPTNMGDALPAVSLGTGRTAVAIAVGNEHACAILDNHALKCWGLNWEGELGYGDYKTRGDSPGSMGDALPAIDVGTGHYAVTVAAGEYETCIILENGRAKCWGDNYNGGLGTGDTANRGGSTLVGDNLPTINLGLGRTVQAISPGYWHTCALLDDNTVKCWGANWSGQLGLGDTIQRGDSAATLGDALPPVRLGTGRLAKAVTAANQFSCALLDDGTIKCWGDNRDVALGVGDGADRGDIAGSMGDALPAVSVGFGRTVQSMAARPGNDGVCVLLDDAAVKCWGSNNGGELGLGDTQWRGDTPASMGDALPIVAVW
jgi:E3 ubiquitin-protein ligase HERC3